MMTRSLIPTLVLATAIGAVSTRAAEQSKAAAPLAVGDTFPRLEAEFLTGRKAVLPDAAAGKSALVMMGFTYDSRFAVEKWAEHVVREFGANETLTFFEVPVIGGMGRMAKWFIDSGMRKGTPKEMHENVITVYGGTGPWKRRLSVRNEKLAYLILLVIPLEQSLKVGLIVLSTAAGAPFLPKLVQGAKGNIAFAVGLMMLLLVLLLRLLLDLAIVVGYFLYPPMMVPDQLCVRTASLTLPYWLPL